MYKIDAYGDTFGEPFLTFLVWSDQTHELLSSDMLLLKMGGISPIIP